MTRSTKFCTKHQHAFINVCTECVKEEQVNGMPASNTPNGFYSNQRITQRNGGIRHQFINSVGGDSSNYR